MVLIAIQPDIQITCPLDDSHRILKSRMQYHLVRCLKNHTLTGMIKCPWNPLHIIDKFLYEDHCQNTCKDLPNVMGSVIHEMQDTDETNTVTVPLSNTNAPSPPMEEDWDTDVDCGTYDPLKNSENKPVLRSAMCLSKSKKKEWNRQERLRFQELGNVLPVQIKSTPKEIIITTDTCRPPHNPGIAMSANASMVADGLDTAEFPTNLRPPHAPSEALSSPGIAVSANASMVDELNPSKSSADGLDMAEFRTNLRPPHGLSPGLSYIPDNTISSCSLNDTTSHFDKAFEFENEQMHETSKNWFANTMRDFERQQTDPVATSCVSRTNTSDHIASLIKFSARISGTDEKATFETAKVQVQNETACLPVIERMSVERSTAVVIDTDNELSQLLAELENKEKKIREEKAAILAQIAQLPQKLANRESNETNVGNHNDPAATKEEGSYPVKSQNYLNSEMPKCAANFAKFKKSEDSPFVGAGHGSVLDSDSLQNRGPDANSEEEKTN